MGLGNGDAGNFLVFLLLLTSVGFCAIGLGMIIASAAPTTEAANAIAPLFVVLMILFGGFYINIESLPVWLQWVQYLSLMRCAPTRASEPPTTDVSGPTPIAACDRRQRR